MSRRKTNKNYFRSNIQNEVLDYLRQSGQQHSIVEMVVGKPGKTITPQHAIAIGKTVTRNKMIKSGSSLKELDARGRRRIVADAVCYLFAKGALIRVSRGLYRIAPNSV